MKTQANSPRSAITGPMDWGGSGYTKLPRSGYCLGSVFNVTLLLKQSQLGPSHEKTNEVPNLPFRLVALVGVHPF